MVAPISRSLHGSPTEVVLGEEEGLKGRSAASLAHVTTVPQAELRRYMGRVHPARMAEVCRALALATGCR
jgi:mRNA-degrading endonuclease toxin of MazEF toxin-antitoxin module